MFQNLLLDKHQTIQSRLPQFKAMIVKQVKFTWYFENPLIDRWATLSTSTSGLGFNICLEVFFVSKIKCFQLLSFPLVVHENNTLVFLFVHPYVFYCFLLWIMSVKLYGSSLIISKLKFIGLCITRGKNDLKK